MKKRVLSLLLALVMLLGLLPGAALAAPAEEQVEVPTLDVTGADAPAQLAAANVTPRITLSDYSQSRAHHGDNWNNGFSVWEGDANRASYDNGTVEVRDNGLTIYTKERDRFKMADYLYLPFELSVDVPAYTAYTITFGVNTSVARNSKGGVHYWLEVLDGRPYNSYLNTHYNTILSESSLGRICFDNKSGGSSTRAWTAVFVNDTGNSKTVSRPMAYYIGASKSTSALTSYHHQVEGRAAFTVDKVVATKTITYDPKGGTAVASQTFTGDSIKLAAAPIRKGYSFQGWKDKYTSKLYAAGADYSENRGMALEAQWTPKTMLVTFTTATAAASRYRETWGEPYVLPEIDPSWDGYTFAGWYTAKSGGSKVESTTIVTAETDHTLYPHWTAKTPTVTFSANGGSVSTASKSVTCDAAYGALPTPTRAGYTFDGWYTAQTGGDKVESTTKVTNGENHTLYAHWTAKTVAVTLNYNDGATANGSLNVTYGGKYTGLPAPAREGYSFLGWYTATSGGTKVEATTTVTNANAHTLYARWAQSTYTVTFNANGGSTVAARRVKVGERLGTLPTPTRTGYTFSGWGDGVSADTVPTGDVTYTAQWTARTYTVTFNPSGGAVDTASRSVTYNATYGDLPTPTRTGYTFGGWYTASSGGTLVQGTTKVTTASNHTIYAYWTAKSVAVTLDPSGGSVSATSQSVTYGGTYGTLPTPTRTGYAFAGWFTAPVGGAKVESTTKAQRAEAHTLYAQWTANTYTVAFNANGGSFSGDTSKSVTFGQPYGTLPVPTKAGNTFAGWYTAASGGDYVGDTTIVKTAGEHTLTAHWSQDHTHRIDPSNASSYIFSALGQTADSGNGITAAGDVLGTTLSTGKNVFLTEDVTISGVTTIAKGTVLNLCLNGHSLTYTGSGDSIFVVQGTLNICDCNGSNGHHTITSPVTGGSVTIDGGLITGGTVGHGSSHTGGAVQVNEGGNFNLYGGAIAGNDVTGGSSGLSADAGHGTVRVEGIFHMYGGEICHNKYGCGGGVNISSNVSHFYLHGGSIHHNYASYDDGGGVCVNGDASFTMSGGSIVDNKAVSGGGGIHSYGGSVTLSGTPTIARNTTEKGGTNYNLRLEAPVLAIGDDFAPAAPIGVSYISSPTASSPVAIGTEGSGDYARYFTADTAGQEVISADIDHALHLGIHAHSVCGESCTHGDHPVVDSWTPLTQDMLPQGDEGKTLAPGNYILTQDLTFTNQIIVAAGTTVNLCLNGHTLHGEGKWAHCLYVCGGGTLNLCDCAGTGQMVCDGYIAVRAMRDYSKDTGGTANLYGGTFTVPTDRACAEVNGFATLTVDGATLTQGSESWGTIRANGGTVEVKSGKVAGTYPICLSNADSIVKLSGSPELNGSTADIYFKNTEGAKLTVADALTGTYTVVLSTAPAEGSSVVITTPDSKDNSAHFAPASTYQMKGVAVRNVGTGDSQTVELYKPHLHNGVEYEGYTLLSADATIEDGGRYLMTVDLAQDFTVPEGATVDLCLNGHTLNGKLTVNGTLNLYDCTGKGKVVTTSRVIDGSGALNWYGGTLEGGNDSNVPIYFSGVVTFYATPTITTECAYQIRGMEEGFLRLGKALEMPSAPYRVNFGSGEGVPSINDQKRVTLTAGWTEIMGESADPARFFAPSSARHAKVVKGENGEAVLRLFEIDMDGTVCYPTYTKGQLTADDLAEPEARVGYLWDGWYTAAEDGEKVTADTVFTADATLYPRWTACTHEGVEPAVTAATCTANGQTVLQCDACGVDETTVLPKLGHDFTTLVNTDPDNHWYICARQGCGAVETDAEGQEVKTEHTFGDWAVTTPAEIGVAGEQAAACGVCGYTKTQAIEALPVPTYDVTYTVDDYTVGEVPTQEAVVKGTSITLPGGLTRTGYTLNGWVLLDELGVPTVDEDGQEVVLSGAFAMPGRDVTFAIRWNRIDNYELKPDETIVLEDGTTITNDSGETVTIDQGGDGTVDATITLPDGGSVTITEGEDGKDQVTVPPGSQVETKPGEGDKGGLTITIGNTGNGKVDTEGGVDVTPGSSFTDKDGNTITIDSGEGGHIDPDGVVTFPEGENGKVTVTDPEGNSVEVTVPGGGEGLDVTPGGKPLVQDPDEKVIITNPDGSTTTITVPEPDPEDDGKPGSGAELDDDGNIILPGGSTVETEDKDGNKTETTIPDEGGAVTPGGDVGTRRPDRELFQVTDIDPEHVTGAIAVLGDADKMEWRKVTDPESPWIDMVPEGSADTTATLDGLAEGSYQFRYKDDGGELGASLPREIRVNNNPEGGKALTIDPAITNGTVSAVRSRVKPGFEVRLTVKPGEGYRLGTLSVTYEGGEPITPTWSTKTLTYNFEMPEADATVTATFVSTAPTHTHVWASVWSHDADYHWHACTAPGCDVTENSDKDGYGAHVYDNDQDKDCNTCGYTRTVGNPVVTPENPVELPNGGSVTKDPDTGDVTITPPAGEGGSTTITPPEGGGDVTVDPDTGEVTVPGGSTVDPGNGTKVELPNGGKVDGEGNITVPGGSTVTIPDGNGGQTEVTVPEGGEGTIKPTDDGKVEVPEGSTVKKPDGTTVTVPEGGGTIDPATGDMTPVKPDKPKPSRPSGRPGTVRPSDTETPDVPDTPTVIVDQFTDVKPSDWYYDSVKTIVAQGLMNGTSEATFSPDLDTSRAMIATILWRLEGSPESKAALTYPDCVAGSWYAKAVAWASEQGVVKGYDSGDFGPDDPITREQLATMLWRYAQAKGQDVSVGENTNILSYTDIDQAGEWAIPALQWAVGSGVMTGRGNGVLDPIGKATRAEAAAMLVRYLKNEK